MKWLKLFENYSEIDEVYINELIEEFCLENDIYYAKDFYDNVDYDVIEEKEYELLFNNILDRNVLICNFDGGINFNLFVYVGYRELVWTEIMKPNKLKRVPDSEIFDNRFPTLSKEFSKLIELIVRSIRREGFFVKPLNLVFPKSFYGFDKGIFLFQVINKIEYHKK